MEGVASPKSQGGEVTPFFWANSTLAPIFLECVSQISLSLFDEGDLKSIYSYLSNASRSQWARLAPAS